VERDRHRGRDPSRQGIASARGDVPGAGTSAQLVGVSRTAFDDGGRLDVRLSAEDLLGAWR
jgi:hypothetical protein